MKIDTLKDTSKYAIIYADPPWHYKQHGSKKDNRGMAQKHYETMTTDDICNLPVNQIKTNDAICFMWATFPNIAEALKVMEAWGFTYKTAAFVWVKKYKKSGGNFVGMGAYTRANAEVCLLGISKGTKPSRQVISHAVRQIIETEAEVIESPIEAHSKKPDVTRDKIVELFGKDISKIELFARDQFAGWDCWGNEV